MTAVDQPFAKAPLVLSASPAAGASGERLSLMVPLFFLLVLMPFGFSAAGLLLTGVRVLLLISFIPMFVRVFTGRCGPILPTDWLFMCHILWGVIALGYNAPDRVVQTMGSTGIEFLGGYLLGRTTIRSRHQMQMMIRCLAIAICATLPFALVETTTGRPLMIELIRALPIVSGAPQTYSEMRMGLTRVQMGYITPIHYGIVCSLVISLCFVGLRGSKMSITTRWVLTTGCCACVFLSLSSGALLPMMMHMFLIGWAWVFRHQKHPWLILLSLIVAMYVGIDVLSNRSPYRVFMSYATFSPGTAYWRDAINQFGMDNVWANPLFGIGFRDWVRPSWMHSSSVDNFWLLMAMRYGILGFLTVATGYAAALWKIGRARLGTDPQLQSLRLAWMFTFGSLAFALYTVHIWAEVYCLVFFLLGSGLWLVNARPEEASATGESAKTLPAVPRGPVFSRFVTKGGTAAAPPPQPHSAAPPASSRPRARFTRHAKGATQVKRENDATTDMAKGASTREAPKFSRFATSPDTGLEPRS